MRIHSDGEIDAFSVRELEEQFQDACRCCQADLSPSDKRELLKFMRVSALGRYQARRTAKEYRERLRKRRTPHKRRRAGNGTG